MAVAEQRRELASPSWTAVLHDWVTTVDHKKIGILYVLMAVGFLVVGGCEALLIRWQLLVPRSDFLGPDTFNQLFTMHGTTMVFFMGMPILIGMGNYLVPLMIGARDMAFPRLNALGFWATLFGGLLVYFSFATGGAPAIGWFAYAPLTERTFARGAATDFWALGLIVSGIGTTTAAMNFIATILGMRAPGMALRKVPFFCLDHALDLGADLDRHPAIDRHSGHDRARPEPGGPFLRRAKRRLGIVLAAPVLVLRPSRGLHSDPAGVRHGHARSFPVFSRKVLFGYEFMAAATMAIAFISLGVWAHHMFAVGMSRT